MQHKTRTKRVRQGRERFSKVVQVMQSPVNECTAHHKERGRGRRSTTTHERNHRSLQSTTCRSAFTGGSFVTQLLVFRISPRCPRQQHLIHECGRFLQYTLWGEPGWSSRDEHADGSKLSWESNRVVSRWVVLIPLQISR